MNLDPFYFVFDVFGLHSNSFVEFFQRLWFVNEFLLFIFLVFDFLFLVFPTHC